MCCFGRCDFPPPRPPRPWRSRSFSSAAKRLGSNSTEQTGMRVRSLRTSSPGPGGSPVHTVSIRCPVIAVPGRTDLYFPPEDEQ